MTTLFRTHIIDKICVGFGFAGGLIGFRKGIQEARWELNHIKHYESIEEKTLQVTKIVTFYTVLGAIFGGFLWPVSAPAYGYFFYKAMAKKKRRRKS